jgi:hypothetical protein
MGLNPKIDRVSIKQLQLNCKGDIPDAWLKIMKSMNSDAMPSLPLEMELRIGDVIVCGRATVNKMETIWEGSGRAKNTLDLDALVEEYKEKTDDNDTRIPMGRKRIKSSDKTTS